MKLLHSNVLSYVIALLLLLLLLLILILFVSRSIYLYFIKWLLLATWNHPEPNIMICAWKRHGQTIQQNVEKNKEICVWIGWSSTDSGLDLITAKCLGWSINWQWEKCRSEWTGMEGNICIQESHLSLGILTDKTAVCLMTGRGRFCTSIFFSQHKDMWSLFLFSLSEVYDYKHSSMLSFHVMPV